MNSSHTDDLFGADPTPVLPPGVILRPGLMDLGCQIALLDAVRGITTEAPFRRPRTRGQGNFSAMITNAGTVGWWSDEKGYRYTPTQPDSAQPWAEMPDIFRAAVTQAVADTPWAPFTPDACLINFYGPGAKMGLHQDKDERDFTQPIVTISLGDAADFLLGGPKRADKAQAFRFTSGDVLLMGPPSRMLFHGVRRIHSGSSPIAGVEGRYSLTFRKAL